MTGQRQFRGAEVLVDRPFPALGTTAVYGAGMGVFTVAEAQRVLDDLRPALTELVAVRADAVELSAAVNRRQPSPLGGLPELKAAEARLDELMTTIQQTGVELKGSAPLLLDFPAVLDGVPVLLCWLEGDGPIVVPPRGARLRRPPAPARRGHPAEQRVLNGTFPY